MVSLGSESSRPVKWSLIEPQDFVGMTVKRDQVYKLDESGIAISCKVMVGIHNLVIIDSDVSCLSYASYPIDR